MFEGFSKKKITIKFIMKIHLQNTVNRDNKESYAALLFDDFVFFLVVRKIEINKEVQKTGSTLNSAHSRTDRFFWLMKICCPRESILTTWAFFIATNSCKKSSTPTTFN